MPNSDEVEIESYIIEVDDGMKGEFQSVHQTTEMSCTLGGLQFRSTYRARVRAVGTANVGQASEVVYLTTPEGKIYIIVLGSCG